MKKNSKPYRLPLSEGKLHSIVIESINKVMKPSAKKRQVVKESVPSEGWMGVEGARYISHGEWADPEIVYNGDSFDYYDFEDVALADYREECPNDKNGDGYDSWLEQKGPDYVRSILDDLASSMWEGEEADDTDKWFLRNHQDLADSAYEAYEYDDMEFEDWVNSLDPSMKSDEQTLQRAWDLAVEEARKNRRWG
jgi:hypothetical protein